MTNQTTAELKLDFKRIVENLKDEDDAYAVVEMFAQHGPTVVVRLTDALNQNNYTEVRDAAHSIKGAVSYLFAEQLRERCAKLESAAAQDNHALVQELAPLVLEMTANLISEAAGFIQR